MEQTAEMDMEYQLMAVSPLDGRYATQTDPLREIVSEYGLFKRRVEVAINWVQVLGSGILPDVEHMPGNAQDALSDIAAGFDKDAAKEVKKIEKTTNHDLNATVRWIKDRMRAMPGLEHYAELTHYGCTSEDLNNMAYAIMMRDLRDQVVKPRLNDVREDLGQKADEYADIPLLARTHGQAASPTTFGKEMDVFGVRLGRHIANLGSITILGKFGGASGNHNALTFAYPEVDWLRTCGRFVEAHGFSYNDVTTQIEPHDWMAQMFREVANGNTILRDLAQDMWLYIAFGEFKQKVVAGEDGSSAMPNKVNPIDWENARGNLVVANALWNCLADNLPISRLQRDLEDSTTQRAIGEAAGHNLVAHNSIKKGLGKIFPDEARAEANLDSEWAVLMEPLQTVMRRYGIEGAYDTIKEASRGKKFGHDDYIQLVESIGDLPDEARARLLALTPATYTGRAAEIVRGY
jgi:adenylosuccinate lyase